MISIAEKIIPFLDENEKIFFEKLLEMEKQWNQFQTNKQRNSHAQISDYQPFSAEEQKMLSSIREKRDTAKLIYSDEAKDSELPFEMFLFSLMLDDISALDKLTNPENYN